MLNNKIVLLVIMGLPISLSVNASPTSNEFIPCKNLAVAVLEYCLKDDDENCWTKSKERYNSCRKDVIQKHNSNNKRVNTEAKLVDEVERKS